MTTLEKLGLLLALLAAGAATGCGGSTGGSADDDTGGTDTTAPSIVTQPQSTSAVVGGGFTLAVTAQGSGTLAYQWFKDGAQLEGATDATHVVASATTADAGSYHVVVSSGYGTVTSAAAVVSVTTLDTSAPEIVSQPASRSVLAGSSVTFSVSATGGGTLGYQWYKGTSAIQGATDASLTFASVTTGDAGDYHAVVHNAYGDATSLTATLTVTTPSADVDDAWYLDDGSNPADLVENTAFGYTVNLGHAGALSVTASGLTVGATTGGVTQLSLGGATVVTIRETGTGVAVTSTLTGGYIHYVLSGAFTNGLTFTSAERFKLTLDAVTITSASGPAIYIPSAVRAFVVLQGQSTLADAATYTLDTTMALGAETAAAQYATILGAGPLLFSEGTTGSTLTLNGKKKQALNTAAHIRIRSGALTLAPTKNAVHAVRAFVMDGGSLAITAADGKGIKVAGVEDATSPLGFVVVNGGAITVTSYDKGITAAWECDEDGDLACNARDPDPFVTINGGTISVTTTGTPCDPSDSRNWTSTCTSTSSKLSPEGIRGQVRPHRDRRDHLVRRQGRRHECRRRRLHHRRPDLRPVHRQRRHRLQRRHDHQRRRGGGAGRGGPGGRARRRLRHRQPPVLGAGRNLRRRRRRADGPQRREPGRGHDHRRDAGPHHRHRQQLHRRHRLRLPAPRRRHEPAAPGPAPGQPGLRDQHQLLALQERLGELHRLPRAVHREHRRDAGDGQLDVHHAGRGERALAGCRKTGPPKRSRLSPSASPGRAESKAGRR
ncbi:MAG: carbohydrate-binding domain-containing protein [Anaeromyxobacter sp.]